MPYKRGTLYLIKDVILKLMKVSSLLLESHLFHRIRPLGVSCSWWWVVWFLLYSYEIIL